ncbi:MAG: hypothetical protein Q8N65_01975 [bacterium]|nr:hypothetical protein [bacterium]
MKKYDGPERRTGKLREKIIEILGLNLSDHLHFSKEIILAEQIHREINRGIGEKDKSFVLFKNFFRELHAIGSAMDVELPIRKIARHIFDRSHCLSKKEHFNRRERRNEILRERIKNLLDDVINGMDFLKPHKPWAESFFIALSERTKKEEGKSLNKKQYGDMLRELDALFLELEVTTRFIRNVQGDLASEVGKEFKDRRTERRKPIEDFELFLASR